MSARCREMYDVYVVLSNRAIMRVKVGFRTKISDVLDDNFGYHQAGSALVLTETVAPTFRESDTREHKDKVAKRGLSLTLTDPHRFSRVTPQSTMEENCIWKDGVLYVIVESAPRQLTTAKSQCDSHDAPDSGLEGRRGRGPAARRKQDSLSSHSAPWPGPGPDSGSDSNSESSKFHGRSRISQGVGGGGGPTARALPKSVLRPGKLPVYGDQVSESKSYEAPQPETVESVRKGSHGLLQVLDMKNPLTFQHLLDNRDMFHELTAGLLAQRRRAPAAPKYRRFGDGLNYECTCANPRCDAHTKEVIVHVGHTMAKPFERPFQDVHLLCNVKCPLCNTPVPSIHGIGFSNCKFTWKRIKADGQGDEDSGLVPPFRYVVPPGAHFGVPSTKDNKDYCAEWATLVVNSVPNVIHNYTGHGNRAKNPQVVNPAGAPNEDTALKLEKRFAPVEALGEPPFHPNPRSKTLKLKWGVTRCTLTPGKIMLDRELSLALVHAGKTNALYLSGLRLQKQDTAFVVDFMKRQHEIKPLSEVSLSEKTQTHRESLEALVECLILMSLEFNALQVVHLCDFGADTDHDMYTPCHTGSEALEAFITDAIRAQCPAVRIERWYSSKGPHGIIWYRCFEV